MHVQSHFHLQLQSVWFLLILATSFEDHLFTTRSPKWSRSTHARQTWNWAYVCTPLLYGKAQEDDIRRGMFTHKKNNIAFKTPLLSSRTPVDQIKSVGPWLFLLVYNHINFPVGLQRIKTRFTFFLPHCSQFSTTQPAHSTGTYATLQHCNFHFCCCFLRAPPRCLILLPPHTSALL